MSGLNKQNADHAYNNFTVTNTGLVNNLVSRTLNNISTNGQIDTDEIVANSVSATVVTSDAYVSPITDVIVQYSTGSPTITNNALVGTISVTEITSAYSGQTSTITVFNENVSAGDVIFLTQYGSVIEFSSLRIQFKQPGSFNIRMTLQSSIPDFTYSIQIQYLIIKNSS